MRDEAIAKEVNRITSSQAEARQAAIDNQLAQAAEQRAQAAERRAQQGFDTEQATTAAKAESQETNLQALDRALDINSMPNEGGVDVTGFIASYMDAGGKDVEGALKYVTDYNEATQRPDVGGEIDEKVSAKQASVDNLVKKLGITEEQAWRITEGVIKVVSRS